MDGCVCCRLILELTMDSDSDFEGFPCSQISFCGYESSQSASFGPDVVDYENGKTNETLVSLEGVAEREVQVTGLREPRSNIIYDNVEIEDISSDENVDNL